jgi:hypothetical protein
MKFRFRRRRRKSNKLTRALLSLAEQAKAHESMVEEMVKVWSRESAGLRFASNVKSLVDVEQLETAEQWRQLATDLDSAAAFARATADSPEKQSVDTIRSSDWTCGAGATPPGQVNENHV